MKKTTAYFSDVANTAKLERSHWFIWKIIPDWKISQ